MALEKEDKINLIKAYAPILLFHPEERFVPVDPKAYLEACALWAGQPADDKKEHWGEGGPGFPRKPLILKGGISLNPAHDFQGTKDPDADGVGEWYLGHQDKFSTYPYLRSHNERELWLDLAGWKDSPDVTDASSNTLCNTSEAERRFKDEAKLAAAKDWYYAEVEELDTLSNLMMSLTGPNSPNVEKVLRNVLGDAWIIWYYFLYPIHEEFLRRCEEVFDEGSDGNYEGDWNAVAVIVRKPLVLPWEHGGHYPEPEYVAYGIRLRGLAEDVFPDLFKQGMLVRPWIEVHKFGTHPRVYVAKGYHNNYSLPGTHNPVETELIGVPLNKLICGGVESVDETISDIAQTWESVKETAEDVTITLGKIVAGAAVGSRFGPFGPAVGALAGGIAGLAEALSSSSDDDSVDPEVRKKLEEEHAPEPGQYGLVLTLPDVPQPLVTDAQDPNENETATEIRVWAGSDEAHLVDRQTQLWWPGEGDDIGYNGRWGVRCQSDPMQRRSGIEFPDFRRALLNDLAVHIAKTTS